MAEPSRTFSLRAHLLLLVIGTLVPALLIAAVLVRQVVDDNRRAVEQRLLEAARAAATVVDAELAGSVRALQGLGESGRLTEGEIPGFYDQARRLLKTQPTWSAVSLSRPDGQQIANTARPLDEPLPMITDRDSFERTLTTRRPVVGNLRLGQITRQLGFIVRVPVLRNDKVVYVLTAWITSSKFADVLRRQTPVPEEWVRGVVDASGVIVARSRDSERFVGQKGTPASLRRQDAAEAVYRDLSLEGTEVYGAFSKAPMSGWTAGVAVPASIVDARFRESIVTLVGMSLLLLGVGGGGAYFISRRISRDLTRAAADAEAIAGGREPSRVAATVTELQRLSDALAQSAALLETHQRERDEQVARANAARAEAEAADRAKDEFLAMLGHELRNPLAPALTAVHLLKTRAAGADTTRERDVIERQIRHMARLVDDLLDISRLRRGAIELRRERFALTDAVARAVEMTSAVFAEKQHQLDLDVPSGLEIHADRVRIAQVLSNLLSNAAKYSEPRAHILLRVREENKQVVLECRDTGIGMSPDLVPRVFELFVQGQRGPDRRQGGLGLGLAVARTLVELHGGTIEATSAGTGQGSTFTVRLPLATPPPVPPTVAADAISAAKPKADIGRVMVVDDNRDALDMLIIALTAAGIEAFGASTPYEALDLAAARHPRAAVLDIGLPQMDGFELARVLRSRDGGAALRLIALTGYGREQDMAAARAAGFDAFFAKPVEVDVLIGALESRAT